MRLNAMASSIVSGRIDANCPGLAPKVCDLPGCTEMMLVPNCVN